MTALEVGNDRGALAVRQRLEPLMAEIQDPHLHAECQLAMAWAAPIAGDFDGALRGALVSFEQLRGLEEPYWTALALLTASYLETAAGSNDEALRHLREARDLADRFGFAWLAAWSRVQLGTVALVLDRLEEAGTLLEEGLDLSLAARSTRNVTLCLGAFAKLALAEGDPERAALLAGAAEGLRRRAGLRAWPMLRRGEAELLARTRQALGAGRFDPLLAAGTQLNRREAVAAVRDQRTATRAS